MAHPQQPIFENDNAPVHHYLEFKLRNFKDLKTVKETLKKIIQINIAEIVVAFGADLWRNLQTDVLPEELRSFQSIHGQNHELLSTQADIFFWVSSKKEHAQSLVFDQAYGIVQALSNIADVVLDLPAFLYHNSLDLMGFEDGSANPKDDFRFDVALIPSGKQGAGGSYLLTQKWVHQLEKFHDTDIVMQEKIIGRTKKENIELQGDDMPKDSHISRTDIKVDGTALKVFRCSKPFGNTQEKGLYFVSFACELRRHQIQLEHMYGASEDGIQDQLLNYSQALTTSYWFAPSIEDLNASIS